MLIEDTHVLALSLNFEKGGIHNEKEIYFK